jgi:nicotinate phosphoribosyltransferase
LQVRRYLGEQGQPRADMIYNVAAAEVLPPSPTIIDPADATRRRPTRPNAPFRDLLTSVLRQGRLVQPLPTLQESRAYAQQEVNSLDASIRRFLNPHVYPVGLEQSLHEFRTQLMLEKRPVRPA